MTYRKIAQGNWTLVENENGATLGYAEASGVTLIEEDGFAFKDLNKNGVLDPYEDWRLPIDERIEDLVSKLSIEQIAGLMLYSRHQTVAKNDNHFVQMFSGTYDGKTLNDYTGSLSNLTDQQKEFLKKDHIRHVLLTIVDSPQIAAEWTNNIQAMAESLDLGIPVNISSDPRHSTSADTEFNAGAGGDISKWPEQLGLAATFDPALVKQFGEIASKEYRALGITTALSPQIDLATEPRWMRFSGTFGEGVKLVTALAKAYCDGFQTTQNGKNGWGLESVNAMVKHWPGGGSGEAGRDGHYGYGKYAVYPGNNFNEHLQPFLHGAFELEDGTQKASAVMPYYTISYNQDQKNHENVGNGFSEFIINDLLRKKYEYDGVVCTDWSITADAVELDQFIGGKSWGVQDLTVEERHYKALAAGVDQFGGNNEIEPVLAAYELGVLKHGEKVMQERFRISARRLLKNIFQTGVFENPYLRPEQSEKIVGNPEFMAAGYNAQQKSLVLLKNKNRLLPLQKQINVYIPKQKIGKSADWFGNIQPACEKNPVSSAVVEKYFQVVDTPEQAEVALVFLESPKTVGYSREDNGNGYLPISLQYSSYTAILARKKSLAGTNRSYLGKSNQAANNKDLETILALKNEYPHLPIIVSLTMKNPTIVKEFEPFVEAIIADFGVQTQAILSVLSGDFTPSGLLPFQMPADMETVEQQKEDVPLDMKCYKDELGHTYDFGYGMDFEKQIEDKRANYRN
ncbi:glycoside hydrolase family 3 protein [Candidatus Enterococcus ikei]|uniref:beta-glucosidase n=1 Tax=Candidatus Enterococcus ikei TaxID=2815326 RepID=A0ABS3GZ06_9ENTE|nr:glycoside hydrolase family 3 N-terminal domain-containing protein [Enterococcus sp. DIV0869a]MBO0440075.1 glycoside hydrolase family 3 C-terminal domain-containing protein [Enterococcus sp. DIV0869a]